MNSQIQSAILLNNGISIGSSIMSTFLSCEMKHRVNEMNEKKLQQVIFSCCVFATNELFD